MSDRDFVRVKCPFCAAEQAVFADEPRPLTCHNCDGALADPASRVRPQAAAFRSVPPSPIRRALKTSIPPGTAMPVRAHAPVKTMPSGAIRWIVGAGGLNIGIFVLKLALTIGISESEAAKSPLGHTCDQFYCRRAATKSLN